MDRREAYIRDTSAPIAVRVRVDIDLYKTLNEETKIAWNRFAQDEADRQNNLKFGPDDPFDSYDDVSSFPHWTPGNFQKWVQEQTS